MDPVAERGTPGARAPEERVVPGPEHDDLLRPANGAVGSSGGSTAVPAPRDAARRHRWGPALRVVQSLPELIVLLVASTVLACGVMITAGRLDAVAVLVLAVALTTVLALSLRRYARAPDALDAVLSLVAVVAAGAWLWLNLPYASEHVLINRDPSVFTLLADWLVDNDAPVIDTAPDMWNGTGFERGADGLLRTQNSHVVPAFAAVVGRVLGAGAVLQANLLVGAAVLLGCYTVARRWVAVGWALLLPLALGLGLPFLVVARGLYTEVSGMLFLLAALTVLSAAAHRPGRASLVATGLLAGGAGMVRIDGLLVCSALLPVLALLLVRHPDVVGRSPGARGRWAAARLPLFVLAVAVPVAVGVVDLLLWSTPSYLFVYTGTLVTAGALFGGMTVLTLAVLLLVGLLARTAQGRAGGRLLRADGAWVALPLAVGTVTLAVAVTAPLWYEGRNYVGPGWPGGSAVVAGLQERLGLPVDPSRSYDEYALVSVAWYHGWAAVGLGGAGMVLLLVAGLRRRPDLLLAPVVFFPLTAWLLYDIEITPDQVWASRRIVLVILPLTLLAAVWLLDQVWREGTAAKVVAGLGAVALVAGPVATLPGVVLAPQELGAVAFVEQLCEEVEGRPVVVVGGAQTIAPTLGIRCGSDVDLVDEVGAEDTARLRRLHGPDVVLVTTDVSSIRWGPEWTPFPPETIDVRVPEWNRQLLQAPDGLVERRLAIWLAEVVPGGPPVPAQPLPDPR